MAGLPQVLSNLNAWAAQKQAGLEGLARVTAANMQNFARANKRWQDRTGNARAGLHGGHYWENPFMLLVFIAHSVEYGLYLELSNDRKYQILEITANQFKEQLYNGAKRIMEQ